MKLRRTGSTNVLAWILFVFYETCPPLHLSTYSKLNSNEVLSIA